MPSTGTPSHRAREKYVLLATGAILGILVFSVISAWWRHRQTNQTKTEERRVEASDPRLTYPTPYRNVRPDVKYVGDQACADCHAGQSESCRLHPMGQALAPIRDAIPIERYTPEAHDPFTASVLHYGIRREKEHAVHREWAADPKGKALVAIETEAAFAIGSGARARSYLVNRDGYLFQSPITWYPRGERWDLSPSYEKKNQHFSRPITPGCLFCHCNYAEHVPDTVNRYKEPIFQGYAVGCERCHGPGELHIRRRQANETVDGLDDTIVNPARLPHALREAVCQQCHLQGEHRVLCRGRSDFDYRPGLPLHLFVMDFINVKDQRADAKFVGSVEQVAASRCYRESREPNKLGCISCHDPHVQPAPEEKIAHYRKRCLACHTEQSCSLSPALRHEKNKDDSCIACHMPRTGSEVNHTSVTDHRVPRRADAPAPTASVQRPIPGPDELVPFHRDLIDLTDEETARNLGVALMGMQDRGLPDAVARRYAEKALPLLDAAVKRDKDDHAAAEARGAALWSLGRRDEALAAFESILTQRPRSEITLHAAGNLALDMNHVAKARSYLERAVEVNPWRWQYHLTLAKVSFRRGEWDRAVRECEQALKLEPFNTASRSLLVQCNLCLGLKDKAQGEFETLLQLTAEERRADLRQWFEGEQRRLGR